MMKRTGSILLIMVFLLASLGLAMAGSKGNARKGKYLYRKNCRLCHSEGATGERAAKPLSPIDKTQAQWQKIFDESNNLACKDVWAKLSEKDVADIYAHLHGHAYDSPSPAKCQ